MGLLPTEQKLLHEIGQSPRFAARSAAQRAQVSELCLKGYLTDVYVLVTGECTARLTHKGRAALSLLPPT